MAIINESICLTLNSSWQPIGYKLVKDAISDLCASGLKGKPNLLALDLDFELDENNNPIYSKPTSMIPCNWEEWIKLPIRHWDHVIKSPRKAIRIPTVMICANYSKMPMRKYNRKPSKNDIFIRDGGICQYSGKKINRNKGTIDHVLAKSKGGKDTWTNLVFCSKDINLKKANKSLDECNLKLLRKPSQPAPTPVCNTINSRHPTWDLFLSK